MPWDPLRIRPISHCTRGPQIPNVLRSPYYAALLCRDTTRGAAGVNPAWVGSVPWDPLGLRSTRTYFTLHTWSPHTRCAVLTLLRGALVQRYNAWRSWCEPRLGGVAALDLPRLRIASPRT